MRKTLLFLVCLALCFPAAPVSGRASALSGGEGEALLGELHSRHQARHTLDAVTDDKATPALTCVFPTDPSEGLLSCADLLIGEARTLPDTLDEAYALFLTAFGAVKSVAEAGVGAEPLNLARYNEEFGQYVVHYMPGQSWWLTFSTEGYDALLLPFYLADAKDEMIDGAAYVMAALAMPDAVQIWLCADQDIVWELLGVMEPEEAAGEDEISARLRAWRAANRPEGEPSVPAPASFQFETAAPEGGPDDLPEETPLPWAADPRVIGRVTVAWQRTVNLREADSGAAKLAARAKPGETLPCVGVTEAGWYQILLPDGREAYVSPKLVTFEGE